MKFRNIVALLLAIAFANAMPLDVDDMVEDEVEPYYLVPSQRERRGTYSWNVDRRLLRLDGMLKYEEALLRAKNYQLGGTAYAAKDLTDLTHLRPERYGGDVKFSHLSGVAATLSADHQRGGPTDVTTGLTYNLFKNKDANVDVEAKYSRQFGVPQGAGKPHAGVFITGEAKF